MSIGASTGIRSSVRAADEPATTQPATTQPADEMLATTTAPAPTTAPSQGGFFIWPEPVPVTGPIVTDRPGFSDSVALVPRGHLQLEGGYSFFYDREGRNRTQTSTFPEGSLRIGLVDWFELRVKWTGWSLTNTLSRGETRAGREINVTDSVNGTTDLSLGFKSPLTKQDGLIPTLSIIPALSVPVGSESKSTGDVDPEIRLAYAWTIDKFTLYGVGLAAGVSDSEGRFFQAGASCAAAYQFTDKFAGIVEYFGLYPAVRGADCSQNINIMATYLITENIQFDIRAGFGLNEQADDFSTSAGLSFRW